MHSYLAVHINAQKNLIMRFVFTKAVWQTAAFKVHRFFGVFRYQEHFDVDCTRFNLTKKTIKIFNQLKELKSVMKHTD